MRAPFRAPQSTESDRIGREPQLDWAPFREIQLAARSGGASVEGRFAPAGDVRDRVLELLEHAHDRGHFQFVAAPDIVNGDGSPDITVLLAECAMLTVHSGREMTRIRTLQLPSERFAAPRSLRYRNMGGGYRSGTKVSSMLALLAITCLSFQQPAPDLRGEIDVVGLIGGIGASPGGDLWVVSRKGRAYVSHDRNETWSEVKLPTREPGEFGMGGDMLAEIDFFDAEHAVISGAIGAGNVAALRTLDGGATWSLVEFPQPLSVWRTSMDSAGNLWLTGHSGWLLVTRDRGATFQSIGQPFGGVGCMGIHFESPTRGVVATTEGAIRLTEDGGVSWTEVTSAASKVQELALYGDRLVAVERGRVRSLRLRAGESWQPMSVEGHALTTAAGGAAQLVGVLDDNRVVQLSSTLAVEKIEPHALRRNPWEMKVTPNAAVLAVDVTGEVAVLDTSGLKTSRMLTAPSAAAWPLRSFDGTESGVSFGCTKAALYRSRDSGKTWERRAQVDSPGPVFAFRDGSGALVGKGRSAAIWRDGEGDFEVVDAFSRMKSTLKVFRRGALWIASGYDHGDDLGTKRMLRSTDTVLVGPGFVALVWASADDGRTWMPVIEVPGCTIRGLFFGDDDVLSLLLTDSTVLRAQLKIEGKLVELVPSSTLRTKVAQFPTWIGWIEFIGGDRGSFGGNNYFDGAVLQTSTDGGRTWTAVEVAEDREMRAGLADIQRIGGGQWLRVSYWGARDEVAKWRDGSFESVRSFDTQIRDHHVDASGRLVVRLRNSEVWALAADGVEWTRLADVLVPSY